jgi:DNA-binding MarR family transcriptional regulator
VFGTIFSTQLRTHLRGVVTGPLASQIAAGGRLTGAQVLGMPPAARAAYQNAYVQSLRPVFYAAAGVTAIGFLLSLLLPEQPLRDSAATSTGLEDGLAAPRSPDSLAEIERALTRVTTSDQRTRFRERIADRAGVDMSPGAIWALVRIDEHGTARARAMAEQDGVEPARVTAVVDELRERGLIAGEDGGAHITEAGREQTERVISARRELLVEALADDSADRSPELQALLRRLARELSGEPPEATTAAA